MAKTFGRPGKTLQRQVILKLMAVGAFAIFALLLLVELSVPIWIAPLAAVGITSKVLSVDHRMQQELHAKGHGYEGERLVGTYLAALPAPWRVFSDVSLGGENADFVAVGVAGVFSIEVKNYSGTIVAKPTGLFTHGQRNDKAVRQSWRASHKLRETLDLEVRPILVFTQRPEGDRVGRLPVMVADELVPFLGRQPAVLDYQRARHAWTILEQLVR